MSSTKHNYPSPGSYAVAQIDLEATLSGVNVPDIRDAALRIPTAKCLVFLNMVKQVPLPWYPTFCFDAWLVGPGLRQEEPDICATSDMCIPIFPAVHHPTGRAPFHPEPNFPFNNCYHWSGDDLWLDLYIKNGEFVQLSDSDIVTMMAVLGSDTADMINNMVQREQEIAGRESHPETFSTSVPLGLGEALDNAEPTSIAIPEAFPTDDGSSFYSERSISVYGSYASEDGEDDINRFSLDDERACQPVVRIWLDLAAQLKEDEIPNPLDFVEQHKALYALLRKYREAEKARLRAEKERAAQQATEQDFPPEPMSPSLWRSLKAFPERLFHVVGSLSCTSSCGHGIE